LNGTTPGPLYLNSEGGSVVIGDLADTALDVRGHAKTLQIGNGVGQEVLKLYNADLPTNMASRIEFCLTDWQNVQIRHNSHDSVRPPFGLHIERTADNVSAPSQKAYLDVEGKIYSEGGTVWHSGNDGSGSGSDADLLDGQHGSYYAPKASPAFTGSPTAPTPPDGEYSTRIATTAFVVSYLLPQTVVAGTDYVAARMYMSFTRNDKMSATNIASFVSPLGGQLTFSSYGRLSGSGTMYIRLINASSGSTVGTLSFTSSSWSTKTATVVIGMGQAYFIEVEILSPSDQGASFEDIIFKTNTPMTQAQRNIASMGFSLLMR
jgi:hypothetical protein